MNEYIKKALVLSASLLMLLSAGAGINNVNARRYHYRYHRHAKRNKYGYWKHYRKHGRTHYYFYHYKTGYFHNGKWIRYHSAKRKRATVRRRHYTTKHKSFLKRLKQQRLNKLITAKNNQILAQKLINTQTILNDIKQGRLNKQNLAHIRNNQVMSQYLAESKAALSHIKQKRQAQQKATTSSNNKAILQQQTALLNVLEHINHKKASSNHSKKRSKVPFRKISSGNTDTESQKENTPERNEAEIKSRSFDDINKDREAYGLAPYQDSATLDQIANIRGQQNAEDPNNPDPHVDPKTGKYFVDEVAQSLGENIDPAENCAYANTGEQYDAEGHDVVFHNGYQMADDDEDSMMNHDMSHGNNNGHRNNILSPYMNQVGIGVGHNNYYNVYFIVEDFI